MKKTFLLFGLLLPLATMGSYAQTAAFSQGGVPVGQSTEMPQDTLQADTLQHNVFFEQLTAPAAPGQGQVTVTQDERIFRRIGNPGVNTADNQVTIDGRQYVQMTGYRIQVFSGNSQGKAKSEAFSKEALIKAEVPEITTYVKFQAPFWRLRVGDFLTYEDAYDMMLRFKKTFVFGREMSIVREKINVPLD